MATRTETENRRSRLTAIREHQQNIRRRALDDIRRDIGALTTRKRETLARVRSGCEAARLRARAAVQRRKEEVRAQLAREVEEIRQAARNRCKARRHTVRAQVETELQRKRRELAEERASQRAAARAETKWQRKQERARAAKERRSESDDEVRANIEPELVPVFDVVRAKVRARPGMSRTEAFLQWAEENPDEIWALRERQAHAQLQALLREERRAARELRKCGGACKHAKERRAALPAAPF